jgi:hypothetical protein
MALRPFLTAGVAFATAGVVAATVAIAPPMSPGDLTVAKNTEVALNADLRDLINTYFGEFPGDPDLPGTVHAFGVLQQLLQNATVNDPRATEVIDSYFEAGLSDVVRLLLTRDNPSPESVELIDAYFNDGLAEATRVYLDLFATPAQQEWIDTYFGDPAHVNDDGSENISQNGVQGVTWKVLHELGLSSPDLDTFWNAQTAENPQAVPATVPVLQKLPNGDIVPVLDADGDPVTNTHKPALDANGDPTFNAAGEQIFTTDLIGWLGNSNPARRGTFGVIYNVIKSTGIGPEQVETLDQFWDGGITEVVKNKLMDATPDPLLKEEIATYFDGGIFESVRFNLLLAAGNGQPATDLINEYFDNGIFGVIRYLLVGPVPTVEGPPVPPEALTTLVNNRQVSTLSVDETLDEKTPDLKALDEKSPDLKTLDLKTLDLKTLDLKALNLKAPDVKTPDVTPLVDEKSDPIVAAPVVVPVSAPVVAPAPAPVVDPAPAPAADPAPASSTKVKDEDENATNVKNGNKFEPIIILPDGATKSKGGGAWGWNGLADRVNGFVKSVQNATGGGAPAAANPGGAGVGGGEGGE